MTLFTPAYTLVTHTDIRHKFQLPYRNTEAYLLVDKIITLDNKKQDVRGIVYWY